MGLTEPTANESPGIIWNQLSDRALAGEIISRAEAKAALNAPDRELLDQLAAAYRVRHYYWENRVRLHFLLNAQSGLCPEDCHYCSQSKISNAAIEKYPLVSQERILAEADRAQKLQAGTFCIVISGRSPSAAVLAGVTDAVREIKRRYDLKICACLGLLDADQARQLAEAGVDRVNHNLNTSEAHYDNICETHDFRDRQLTIETVRASGMTACSGGIIGMGETDDDIIDLALSLRSAGATSVPVNFFIPIPGTPLAEKKTAETLDPRRCLRVLCLFRWLLPSQEIRIAGGRELHLRSLQPLGLYPANSLFVADYLTTPGQAASADWEMIRDAGFVLETSSGEPLPIIGKL